MARDCLCFLSYAAKHPNEPQSIRKFARVCGIPPETLRLILIEAKATQTNGQDSLLHLVAHQYHYTFKVHPLSEDDSFTHSYRHKVIDVVYWGPIKWGPEG